jgi:hypothetical protein
MVPDLASFARPDGLDQAALCAAREAAPEELFAAAL